MSDPMEQFRESFLEESSELVDSMEGILLRLDPASVEPEDLHTLFRVAHSIKGNAATFGFPAISAFTHTLESTLEPVRQGQVAMDGELQELLLESVDTIRAHLARARSAESLSDREAANQARILQSLLSYGKGKEPSTAGQGHKPSGAEDAPVEFQINFAAPADAFRRGVNLERLFRDLGRLGNFRTWLDERRFPPFELSDPETCYLAWDIRLATRASIQEIEEVFEFVNEGDNLQIRASELQPEESKPLGELLIQDGLVSPSMVREALAKQQRVGEILRDMGALPPETLERVVEQQQKKKVQADASTVRVSTEKIDRLVNLVGELVITQAMLAQSSQSLGSSSGQARFNEAMLLLDRQTRELQERVMGVRMVPMELVFSRFPRMVRELGKQLGKNVALLLEGQATELDKTFVEMLVDPLTHLVRNAIDHGLESSEQREASGKALHGTLILRASSRSGSIFIEVIDDGRGLDRARILAKGLERGLVGPDARLADEEVYALLFEPGFSTAETVSDVSGRGVGLDVVRQNIRSLGGRIEVESQVGKGTTFRLILPLTLAILDGLTVRIGDETYVFPLASVLESFQPRQEEVQSLKGERQVISLRGEFIPVLPLHRVLGIPKPDASSTPSQPLLVVVESEGKRAAMAVDELLGQQQVVIKSLEAHFRKVEGLSGATILGDGRVALILDPPALLRLDCAAPAEVGG